METEASNRGAGVHVVIIRTFALLLGIAAWLLAAAILVNGFWFEGVEPRKFAVSREGIGAFVAVVAGAVLVYRGARRPRPETEASLNALIRKYERQGKTAELAEARERLIRLLIEKDE